MMTSKKFKSFLTSIPKERLLLETDSPFTHSKYTHSDELSRVALALEEEKELYFQVKLHHYITMKSSRNIVAFFIVVSLIYRRI